MRSAPRSTFAAAAAAVAVALAAFRSPASATPARPAAAEISIVPRPLVERWDGSAFVWPHVARVRVDGPPQPLAVQDVAAVLRERGIAATRVHRGRADVVLQQPARRDPRLGDEGYALATGPSGVRLRANGARGLAYGIRTLAQMTARTRDGVATAGGTVVDHPAYRWRGLHLDVARHYFPVTVIERYIDVAARYKLNVFHWHLTDDQAWRFDDPAYPSLGLGTPRYSAADVREIVAYAARRFVTVVPEIDMPAHMSSAVRAYGTIGCARYLLCMQGSGLAFAQNVLSHAVDAFPSPYVHVGGDEVPAPASRRQPAFTAHLERHLEARGRRLVGWDEIADGRLSPRSIVMVWTSRARALRAIRRGNDVVVTSGPLYFDRFQGDPSQEPPAAPYVSTLEDVYDDPVIPPGTGAREMRHVLGVQANVWTEKIATPEHLFAMTLPRALALAEIAWTPRARKSWPSFLARLPAQFAWLDAHGFRYRIPNVLFDVRGGRFAFESVPGRVQAAVARTAVRTPTVALQVPLERPDVRYTLDGSVPSPHSARYRAPFALPLTHPIRLRARAYAGGHAGEVTDLTLVPVTPAAVRARRRASTSFAGLVSP